MCIMFAKEHWEIRFKNRLGEDKPMCITRNETSAEIIVNALNIQDREKVFYIRKIKENDIPKLQEADRLND